MQAAGSGTIQMKEKYLENLKELIGVQFQGYKSNMQQSSTDIFKLGPDSLIYLEKLIYLNIENVEIQQRELENQISDSEYIISTIVKFARHGDTTYIVSNVIGDDGENHTENDIQSQLMFLSPRQESDSGILPYNDYKKKKEEQQLTRTKKRPTSLEPKIKVAFTNLPSLLQLRISECNLDGISWDMFYKLNNLNYLVLERNDLLFLPDFVFYGTPNLTALSLAENRILNLQTVGLAGLLQLQKLDVTSNNLTYLSELSLPPFPHLEVADFRFNPIQSIFPNTFEVMNTTKTLYLGSPSVPLEILTNSFFGLTSLLRLEIDNVKVEILEKQVFNGMPNLKVLVMNGKVTRISFDAFNEIPTLEKLILKHCAIKKISMDAFTGLTSLTELDLSHNLLSFLPTGLLDEQVSLQEIYIQHNQLVSLPVNLFDKSPFLQMIRLNENPWHCSCDMINWNFTQIHKVKRYGITKNLTICQRQYDKGSMCLPEHIRLEAKYVYEKKVSPICATPMKFSNKGVSQVIRKELKFCSSSATSNAQASSKIETVVLPFTISKSKYKIVKTQEQIDKEMEKQIYFANKKTAKVRKPQQGENLLPSTSNLVKQNLASPIKDDDVDSNRIVKTSSKKSREAKNVMPTITAGYNIVKSTNNSTKSDDLSTTNRPTIESSTATNLVRISSTYAPTTTTTLGTTTQSEIDISVTQNNSLPPETTLPISTTSTSTTITTPRTITQNEIDISPLQDKILAPETILPKIMETSTTPENSEEEPTTNQNTASRFQDILDQYKKNYFQTTTKKPFLVTKPKIPPKHPRQLKFGSSKPAPVLSKNAIKLARIHRKLEKRQH